MPTFLDAQVPQLLHNADDPGAYRTFYAQQTEAVSRRLAGARVILDIGCGPRLLYRRPLGTREIIGLDPSEVALRQNGDVDLRLHSSATRIGLQAASVNAIVCFYSLHHIVGRTVPETRGLVERSLREFRRVLTRPGQLCVVEVAPAWPMVMVQRLLWTLRGWSMFFWTRRDLTRLVAEEIPGSALTLTMFRVPWRVMLPPVFAWPWLRLPRGLYPFHLLLYHWRLP